MNDYDDNIDPIQQLEQQAEQDEKRIKQLEQRIYDLEMEMIYIRDIQGVQSNTIYVLGGLTLTTSLLVGYFLIK